MEVSFKCSLTELTTRSDCSQLLSVVLLYMYLCMRCIPCALHGTVLFIGVVGRRSSLCGNVSGFSLPPPLYFPLFISVTGACLLEGVGAHGWFARFCQQSVQTPSWCWLPKWKLQDGSDTQRPLNDAVVNYTYHHSHQHQSDPMASQSTLKCCLHPL